MRFFYNLLFPFVLVALLPSFVLRMLRRGNYRHKFGQRFGIYSRRVREKLAGGRWTWVHAVSVGEVMVALKLIDALRRADPGIRVVLTTTTSTGYRLAHRHRSATLEPVYNPLDFPPIVTAAFRAFRPERLVLVEAEVWPNIVARARRAGIPRILVNARLSPRSEKRYRMVRLLAGPLFNSLDAICLQEPGDIPRWLGIGVKPSRLHLTGSVKFDSAGRSPATPSRDFRPVLDALGVAPGAPVLIAGSTFDGEEILLAGVVRGLREKFPGLFLVLVPRHAERGRSVRDQLAAEGFHAALRSGDDSPASDGILIVNTTGELRDWYACATVVYIGKSLARSAKGGQNPAEAIEAGKPVVFGPNMQNFEALARQLVQSGGAVRVDSAAGLESAIGGLLADPARRNAIAARGADCLAAHAGAAARTAEMILGRAAFPVAVAPDQK